MREVQVLELWERVGGGHVHVPLHLDVLRQICSLLDVEWNLDPQEVGLLALGPPEAGRPILDLLVCVVGSGVRTCALSQEGAEVGEREVNGKSIGGQGDSR